jgi:ATP-dependent helicase HrpA
VANGICIRLYDEKDFERAAALHRPGNPAQSSLAGVILRMKSLRLGRGRGLPVPRAPTRAKAIADGYQLLNELGAVDEANRADPRGAMNWPACRWTRAWAA